MDTTTETRGTGEWSKALHDKVTAAMKATEAAVEASEFPHPRMASVEEAANWVSETSAAWRAADEKWSDFRRAFEKMWADAFWDEVHGGGPVK